MKKHKKISETEIRLAKKNGVTEDIKKRLIIERVRERYDANDEMAILRQRDTKPEEYEAYNTYIEECKAEIKQMLSEETDE